MDQQLNIPRRVLSGLLSSLSAGVVPRVGAPYIAIGRTEEIDALSADLDEIAEGGSRTRFLVGKYGSGKTFLIQLLRGYALEHGFVCADCDLSPERKLCGRTGSGLSTYRELMKNFATRTSPDGGGLAGLISRWLDGIALELASGGFIPDSLEFHSEFSKRVYGVATQLESEVGGFDFSQVLLTFYRASKENDDLQKSRCMRWLRGEYETRTEARSALRVGSIVDDDNWFDFIKLFALFVSKIGYKGMLVFFDECVNLYKIVNRVSRENNYEKLLSMYNDTLQGRSPHLGLIFGGTPAFLEDPRRGLYSYEALKSRLDDAFLTSAGSFRTLTGPIIRLRRMSDNELLALCRRLNVLHEKLHGVPCRISDGDAVSFLKLCLDRPGADSRVTPREIIREYLAILDVMKAHPDLSFQEVLGGRPLPEAPKAAGEDDGPVLDGFDLN